MSAIPFGRLNDLRKFSRIPARSPAVEPVSTGGSASWVLVSTPWDVTQATIESAGSFAGKVVIDATNPLLPSLAGLAVGTTTSAAELVSLWAPGARVVKAFNTVGNNIMANPRFGETDAVLFYCGDDAAAKATVHQLATELGFDARDAGLLTQARLLEPFALLWISLALAQAYGREIAFQLLRRRHQWYTTLDSVTQTQYASGEQSFICLPLIYARSRDGTSYYRRRPRLVRCLSWHRALTPGKQNGMARLT